MLLKRNQCLDDFIASVRDSERFEDGVREQVVTELLKLAHSFRPRIVVNKTTNAYEAKIAANILSKYARQMLHIEPENLGHVYFDKCVSEAVNSGIPFIVSRPRLKISGCISDVANRLGYF